MPAPRAGLWPAVAPAGVSPGRREPGPFLIRPPSLSSGAARLCALPYTRCGQAAAGPPPYAGGAVALSAYWRVNSAPRKKICAE